MPKALISEVKNQSTQIVAQNTATIRKFQVFMQELQVPTQKESNTTVQIFRRLTRLKKNHLSFHQNSKAIAYQ